MSRNRWTGCGRWRSGSTRRSSRLEGCRPRCARPQQAPEFESVYVGANGVYPQEVTATVYLCIVVALERLVTGTTAAIGVREENGTLAFEIVAEEAGVDPADTNLAAMRDRVEALGGRLTITAVSGGSTRIAGSLPTRADASRSRRGRGSPP